MHDIEVPQFLLPVRELIHDYAVLVTKYLVAGETGSNADILKFSVGPTMDYICHTLDAASKKEMWVFVHILQSNLFSSWISAVKFGLCPWKHFDIRCNIHKVFLIKYVKYA